MIRKLYWRIRLLLELNRSDIKSIMKDVFPPKEFILHDKTIFHAAIRQ